MRHAIILLAIFMGIVSAFGTAEAATKAKSKNKRNTAKPAVAASAPSGQLSRELHFDDAVVRGKYQYADEATAIVENEKTLDDLVGMRTNFKDRIKREIDRQ